MKSIKYFYIIVSIILMNNLFVQPIPYGISSDTSLFIGKNKWNGIDTIPFQIYYYMPMGYDSISSPILLAIHGTGANGTSPINDLMDIADRRNALIVAPCVDSWISQTGVLYSVGIPPPNCSLSCDYVYWFPEVFKSIYRHVLSRINRANVPVYLIGFSAGGQLVTRYMLVRQVVLDSIPIQMAVSTSPAYYTFCTDSLNGIVMTYPCGISYNYNSLEFGGPFIKDCDSVCVTNIPEHLLLPLNYSLNKICDEHIIQYYLENYAVLIGTADTNWYKEKAGDCKTSQGMTRYERAINFFNFSTNDAIQRGITLRWNYGEITGVAHDQHLLYNTVLSGDSIPLAERLLFETPVHTVPYIAPLADFTVDTVIVTLPNAIVIFSNLSINSTEYLWDFGDSTQSTDISPSHTYLYADTFTVSLTAISLAGCENKKIKYKYIIVKDNSSIADNVFKEKWVYIYPNPANDKLFVELNNYNKNISIIVFNLLGQEIKREILDQMTNEISISNLAKGIYNIRIYCEKEISNFKIIKE